MTVQSFIVIKWQEKKLSVIKIFKFFVSDPLNCFHEKNCMVHPRLEPTYHHNHEALNTMRLRSLGYPDSVVNLADNLRKCFYYNVPHLMGLRYSPVLKRKLIQSSDSIQSYHTI